LQYEFCCADHTHGVGSYRLRITVANKLILTKRQDGASDDGPTLRSGDETL
jgi:hypothetical protein